MDEKYGILFSAASKGHMPILDAVLTLTSSDRSFTIDPDALIYACANAHMPVIQRLLKDKRVDPSDRQSLALTIAARNHHAHVVALLLQHPRIDPTRAVVEAVERKHENYDILFMLLNDHRIHIMTLPIFNRDVALEAVLDASCRHGHLHVARYLIEQVRLPLAVGYLLSACKGGNLALLKYLHGKLMERPYPFTNQHGCVLQAIRGGHADLLRWLLQKEGAEGTFGVDVDTALSYACAKGRLELIRLLLVHPCVSVECVDNGLLAIEIAKDEGASEESIQKMQQYYEYIGPDYESEEELLAASHQPLKMACKYGHVDVVRLLLTYPSMLLSFERWGSNAPLCLASEHGYLDVVDILLEDPRLKLSAYDQNLVIRLASENGHADIVRALLKSDRFTDLVHDNEAIIGASEKGWTEVVRLLLADRRINPAAKQNEALKKAKAKGRLDVALLLLADQRVAEAWE